MSTSATVRAAWDLCVWQQATIQAITSKIYDYDAAGLASESITHNDKLLLNQEYNFIQYRVAKTWEYQIGGQARNEYRVTIEYYKQADIAGVHFNDIEDAFQTIHDTVVAQLGGNWNVTVDGYGLQNTPINIGLLRIQNVPVWKGTFTFVGFQTVTL